MLYQVLREKVLNPVSKCLVVQSLPVYSIGVSIVHGGQDNIVVQFMQVVEMFHVLKLIAS